MNKDRKLPSKNSTQTPTLPSQIGLGINSKTIEPQRTDKSLQKIPQDVIEGTQILSIFFLGQNL